MKWYDDITDAEIENLKENYIRLDLLDVINPITGQNMRKIPCGLVKHWISGDGWQKSFAAGLSLLQNMTYRLRTDWKRPEPEWYDGMATYELMALQRNEISLGLLDAKYSVIGQNMRKIPYGLVEYWSVGEGDWQKSGEDRSELFGSSTYRLRPDWERPEPEWYDGMYDYELLTLQKNEISLGLLDTKYSVTGQNMRKIPYGLIQYWNSAGCSWEKSFSNGSALLPDITYKLNPDWCRMGDGDGK